MHRHLNIFYASFFHAYLKIGPEIFCDIERITLTKNHDFLLNVLDFILGLFEVDDLDGHNMLGTIVDPLVHFAEGALADSLLLSEYQLGIHSLQKKEERRELC